MMKVKKTIITLDEDLHEWLREYKQSSGRSIEWTINFAIRQLKETDERLEEMAKKEGGKKWMK